MIVRSTPALHDMLGISAKCPSEPYYHVGMAYDARNDKSWVAVYVWDTRLIKYSAYMSNRFDTSKIIEDKVASYADDNRQPLNGRNDKILNAILFPKQYKSEDIKVVLGDPKTDVDLKHDTLRIRGLLRIYQMQTEEEQNKGDTRVINGIGFSGFDGKIMTRMTKELIRTSTLDDNAMRTLRYKIPKYSGQLAKISNARLPNDPLVEQVTKRWIDNNKHRYKQ